MNTWGETTSNYLIVFKMLNEKKYASKYCRCATVATK